MRGTANQPYIVKHTVVNETEENVFFRIVMLILLIGVKLTFISSRICIFILDVTKFNNLELLVFRMMWNCLLGHCRH